MTLHTILKLSCPGNTTTFRTVEIRSAVVKTAKWLARRAGRPEPNLDGLVVTETGGGRGPYFPTARC